MLSEITGCGPSPSTPSIWPVSPRAPATKPPPEQFDDAIAALRKASHRQELPRGYLARAGFRRAQGDVKGARDDLDQVRHIAQPSGMRLYLCDAAIEEAWLHHLSGDAKEARKAFDKAEAEVSAMGYHWQDEELDILRQALD